MRDLNEVLHLQLSLPIGGKVYVVNPPPADVAARLLNRLTAGMMVEAGIEVDDNVRGQVIVCEDEEPDFARDCLGPTYDAMVADRLSHAQIEFCVTVAFLCWTIGRDYAELWWDNGGKVGRPATAQPMAALPRTETPTPTGAASTSPTSASVSGTRTRRQPQDHKAKRSPRSGQPTAT